MLRKIPKDRGLNTEVWDAVPCYDKIDITYWGCNELRRADGSASPSILDDVLAILGTSLELYGMRY